MRIIFHEIVIMVEVEIKIKLDLHLKIRSSVTIHFIIHGIKVKLGI